MAISVDVAKDPKAIKQKFIGSFTRRQFFCFSAAAVVGVPFYLMTRKSLGTDVSALMMVAVMLPFFFLGIYEKDGVPAEKYLMQIIEMKFLRPGIRRYEVVNLYEQLRKREKMKKEVEALEEKRKRRKEELAGKIRAKFSKAKKQV
ncbi:MAG: PrgI family protein [Lachnospiraceae bacterium]|nr:PrgI family protein [Lachnospiraceae bacterium]